MSVTYASLIVLFPEFTTSDVDEQSRIATYIANAAIEVNSTSWGAKTDMGVSYLAAHWLAMAARTAEAGPALGASGPLEEATVGKLKVKFGGAPTGENAFALTGLNSTSYGIVYVQLRSTLSLTPIVI